MKIAENIANSDINNIDRLIKKDLIFIMQVSQKPRTLALNGFLTFDLGAFRIVSYMIVEIISVDNFFNVFIQILQSAYSYVAILRQIYK